MDSDSKCEIRESSSNSSSLHSPTHRYPQQKYEPISFLPSHGINKQKGSLEYLAVVNNQSRRKKTQSSKP